jgi:hypothetical protein
LIAYFKKPNSFSRGGTCMKHIDDTWVAETADARLGGPNPRAERRQEDPLHRLTPTPFVALLPIMGRTVRLETNSARILNHLKELFARYPRPADMKPGFSWKIVSEGDVQGGPPWPKRSVFSGDGLRFAEFGQRNFLAVDIEAREAVAFVSDGLAKDVSGFTSPFIDTLFYMTSGSLGLVPFQAACVASGAEGLLILGAPNQGKTTASYLAAKGGLTYFADQSVFLEVMSSRLHAWGDFVPVAFRPETLEFLPELKSMTHRFSYCDFSFYYWAKQTPDSSRREGVTPVCCVILEREAASTPRLFSLPETDRSKYMTECVAFRDEERFGEQRLSVLERLRHLPAYHLAYSSNPATVAPVLRELLTAHSTY